MTFRLVGAVSGLCIFSGNDCKSMPFTPPNGTHLRVVPLPRENREVRPGSDDSTWPRGKPLRKVLTFGLSLNDRIAAAVRTLPGVELIRVDAGEPLPPAPALALADLDSHPDVKTESGLGPLPWLFFSSDPAAHDSAAPVLGKRVSEATIRRLVLDQLAAQEELAPFSAADYVQLACNGMHSVRVDIEAPTRAGTIHIRKGKPWAAYSNDSTGVAAFRALAFLEGARVACVPDSSSIPQNLPKRPAAELLLEAAQALDESIRDPETWSVETPDEDPRSLAQLLDEAMDALLGKDHARALDLYEQASTLDPNDPVVKTNLGRLRQMLPKS